MITVEQLVKKNVKENNLPHLDVEVILAYILNKSREFVLIHPETILSKSEQRKFNNLIKRRLNNEPIAYLIGHKEFYGLNFLVNKHTLIPRPETELMVEQAVELLHNTLRNNAEDIHVIDIGTGSGCIITSIASQFENMQEELKYYAIDISKDALKVAKQNAKIHGLNKRIKFLHGSLLEPFIQNTRYKIQHTNLVITANLPYLSKKIYESAADNVKKYEPKSALYSPMAGLDHYAKMLKQLEQLISANNLLNVVCFLEISPEQKQPLAKLIKSILPKANITFTKDLAGKWRVCKVSI